MTVVFNQSNKRHKTRHQAIGLEGGTHSGIAVGILKRESNKKSNCPATFYIWIWVKQNNLKNTTNTWLKQSAIGKKHKYKFNKISNRGRKRKKIILKMGMGMDMWMARAATAQGRFHMGRPRSRSIGQGMLAKKVIMTTYHAMTAGKWGVGCLQGSENWDKKKHYYPPFYYGWHTDGYRGSSDEEDS